MFLQTNQLTGQASIIKQYLHPQLLCMSFKCSERAFACKNSSPYVFGQSVPGKPQIRPLFPQHTNFSGTCDSNNDRNHSFHFLSNWRRNGERIKTTVSNFSNTCYWVCSGSSSRRRKSCDLSNLLPHLEKSCCYASKSCRTRKWPFPFRPPAAVAYHHTFISLPFYMSFRPQLPPYIHILFLTS